MAQNQMVQAPSQLEVIAQLTRLLGGGGEVTRTSPGDTAALRALIGQLQGADYSALLQSIFQQAAGQIPGIQQAHARAVGARTENNSATQAALEQLLKATTIAAQDRLVSQKLENQKIQANAAANIAQATKGTEQTRKPQTITGSPLGDIAALVAVLQGARALTGNRSVSDMLTKLTGGTPASATTASTQLATPSAPVSAPSRPIQSAASPYALGSGQGTGLRFGGVTLPTISTPVVSVAPPAANTGLRPPVTVPTNIGNFSLVPIGGSGGLGLRAPTFTPTTPHVPGNFSLAALGSSGGLGLQLPRNFNWF